MHASASAEGTNNTQRRAQEGELQGVPLFWICGCASVDERWFQAETMFTSTRLSGRACSEWKSIRYPKMSKILIAPPFPSSCGPVYFAEYTRGVRRYRKAKPCIRQLLGSLVARSPSMNMNPPSAFRPCPYPQCRCLGGFHPGPCCCRVDVCPFWLLTVFRGDRECSFRGRPKTAPPSSP